MRCRSPPPGVLDFLNRSNTHCPLCREPITRDSLLTLPRAKRFEADLDAPECPSSAKVDALMSSLLACLQEEEEAEVQAEAEAAAEVSGATGESESSADAGLTAGADASSSLPRARSCPIKSVIFSQWTGMLDIVEAALRKEPKLSTFCRLDGGMSSDERQRALRRFREERHYRVMLLSLKAGGVGLNLTSASRVYLLDPWFNPAVEEQAMDRVHRLGQERPVIVTRFVVKNTVEDRMLSLQESKREECQLILGGADREAAVLPAGRHTNASARREARDKARKLRLSDLQHYFS